MNDRLRSAYRLGVQWLWILLLLAIPVTSFPPLVDLVGAPDVRKAWRALGLDRQRTVLRAALEVTLKTPRQGRMPDGGYFDFDAVVFRWLRGGASST